MGERNDRITPCNFSSKIPPKLVLIAVGTVNHALYQHSENNDAKRITLYKYIILKENILLAYRNIKANTASKTEGTDSITIVHYKMKIQYILKSNEIRLASYRDR